MITLYESILGSTKSGKLHLVDELKNNIKHCKKVSEFEKIWFKLGLSVENYHWGYVSGSGYSYNYNQKYIILCAETTDLKKYASIFIYDDEDRWPENFDVEKYIKMVSKTLHMVYDYNEGGWYELKFK